ncbi:NAD-dependent epimerase/dehydratase family protein, partial [Chloroflexota bacterium]
LMVDAAIAGKPLDLSRLCGLTRGSHTYVRDIAKAIGMIHLAPSLKHSIYNASCGELHSYGDFVEAIKEVIPGTQIKLGTTRSEKDVDHTVLSIDRIKEDVGFAPDYDIKKGVKAYIEWVRDGKYN